MEAGKRRLAGDTARAANTDEAKDLRREMRVVKIGKSVDSVVALGESIGIEKISSVTEPLLFVELKQMMESKAHAQDYYEADYERLVDKGIFVLFACDLACR